MVQMRTVDSIEGDGLHVADDIDGAGVPRVATEGGAASVGVDVGVAAPANVPCPVSGWQKLPSALPEMAPPAGAELDVEVWRAISPHPEEPWDFFLTRRPMAPRQRWGSLRGC